MDVLTAQEACEYLSVSSRTLDRLVQKRELKVAYVGRLRRFRQEWLDDFLNKQSTASEKESENAR